jgi:hypothetical protein
MARCLYELRSVEKNGARKENSEEEEGMAALQGNREWRR